MLLSDIPERLRFKFSRFAGRVRARFQAGFQDGRTPVFAALAIGLLSLALLLFVLLRERPQLGERFAVPEDDGILTRFTKVHPRSPLAPGVRAFHAGYSRKSIGLFRALLKRPGLRKVERRKVFNYIGYLYLSMGRRAAATAAFRASVRVSAENSPALHGLGRVAQQEKRYPEAVRYYKGALSVSPAFRKSLWRLGQVHLASRKPGEAVRAFQASLNIKDDPRVRYELGNSYLQLSRMEAAQVEYKRVLDFSPTEVLLAYASARLGDIHDQKGAVADALQYYRLAVRYYPGKFAFRYNLGLLLLKAGEWGKALTLFRNLLPTAPSGSVAALARTLGELHYDRKNYDEALRYFRLSLKSKEDLDVAAVVADLYYLRRAYTKALLLYERIIRDFPETQQAVAAMINAGNIRLLQDNYVDALVYYGKAQGKDKRNSRLWYNMGVAYWRLRLFKKAESAFLEAYRLDPLYSSALRSAARSIVLQGHSRRALNLYLDRIARKGSSASSWMYLAAGRLFRQLGQYDNAGRFLLKAEKGADLKKERVKALQELARLYLESGRPSAVYSVLQKADSLLPASALTRYLFALALLKEGRYRDASDNLYAALLYKTRSSLRAEILFRLGNIAFRRGDYSGALSRFRRVLELVPGHRGAQYNASRCAKELRR